MNEKQQSLENKYKIDIENNSAKYFNKKHKMPVIINFAKESHPEVKEEIIETLKNEYIEKMIGISA